MVLYRQQLANSQILGQGAYNDKVYHHFCRRTIDSAYRRDDDAT